MAATPHRELVEEFARRLHDAMTENGLSQSDLAKKVWGTTTDPRGFEVAKNRDRISQYVNVRSLPDRENSEKIANALGMAVGDLIPDRPSAMEVQNPEVDLKTVAGTDRVRLTVNKLVSLKKAADVIKLLADE